MSFLKLVLGFAPWIAFLVIARGSLERLEAGLVVALALTVLTGVLHLSRGIIFWIGLGFFLYATVAVLGFGSMWTVRYMGVLTNGALAVAAWGGLAARRPFTLDYSRASAPRELWEDPVFLRTNDIICLVWAASFTLSATLSWAQTLPTGLPGWGYDLLSYASMLAALGFTSWYPAKIHRLREAERARAMAK